MSAYGPPLADLSLPAQPASRLRDSVAAFYPVKGADLLKRTDRFYQWVCARIRNGTWLYSRVIESRDGVRVQLLNPDSTRCEGINFGSQDYLGLNDHPALRDAVTEALLEYGPHSAGSDIVLGNSRLSEMLRRELGEFLGREQVLLFPTGWAAAYGTLRGLVRRNDYVVLDQFAHNSLRSGAHAATENILYFDHNSVESAELALRSIRSRNTGNAIVLVTESLFSMDADAPDLGALSDLCDKYTACFLVDVAHDLGAVGVRGLGRLEEQKALDRPDLIIGAFSKTFCATGGFLALRSQAAAQYVRCFGDSNTFSNAMSPLQVAAARAALAIVGGNEGIRLRATLNQTSCCFRRALRQQGLTVLGEPGPIVPVLIGGEESGRCVGKLTSERGLLANTVEYPAVPLGTSRLRLQLSPQHAMVDLGRCAEILASSVRDAGGLIG